MKKVQLVAKWLFYITIILSFLVTNMNIANFVFEDTVERVSQLSDKFWIIIFVLLGVLSILFVISCISKRKELAHYTEKFEKYEFIVKYLLIVVACLAAIFGRSDRTMLLILILSSLAFFADFHEIEIITAAFMISAFVLTFVLLFAGILGNLTLIRPDGTIRYSFGFAHPNRLALMLVFGFFSVWLADRKKNIYLYTIFAVLIGIITVIITDSRTAVISLFLFVVLLWMQRLINKYKKNRLVKKTCEILFVLLPLICLFITILLGFASKSIPKLGETSFSIRFSEMIDAIRIYGIKPYGRIIYYYFDNMYAKILFRNGYIVFAVFMSLLVLVNWKAVRNRNWPVVIMLTVVQVYGLMEQVCYSPVFIALIMFLFVPQTNQSVCNESLNFK